jgi:hypothetical protein
MNLKDRIMEWLLAAFDRHMDWITFGAWTRVRGQVIPNIKVRKQL